MSLGPSAYEVLDTLLKRAEAAEQRVRDLEAEVHRLRAVVANHEEEHRVGLDNEQRLRRERDALIREKRRAALD